MNDPYPTNVTIEIDRPGLLSYLRAKWLFQWVGSLAGLGLVFGIPSGMGAAERQMKQKLPDAWETSVIIAENVALGFAIGGAIGMSFGVIGYLAISHRMAKRYADSLEVNVEGQFLRVRQN